MIGGASQQPPGLRQLGLELCSHYDPKRLQSLVGHDVITLLLLKRKRECDLSVVPLQLQLFRMVRMLRTRLLSALLAVQLIFLPLVSKFIHRLPPENS